MSSTINKIKDAVTGGVSDKLLQAEQLQLILSAIEQGQRAWRIRTARRVLCRDAEGPSGRPPVGNESVYRSGSY